MPRPRSPMRPGARRGWSRPKYHLSAGKSLGWIARIGHCFSERRSVRLRRCRFGVMCFPDWLECRPYQRPGLPRWRWRSWLRIGPVTRWREARAYYHSKTRIKNVTHKSGQKWQKQSINQSTIHKSISQKSNQNQIRLHARSGEVHVHWQAKSCDHIRSKCEGRQERHDTLRRKQRRKWISFWFRFEMDVKQD